jgi:large subunit ribosomal protein L13
MLMSKTYMARPGELERHWFVVDATDKVVGRLASEIAMILMGKHRPTYTPHVDTGDFVIVINVEKIAFSDPNKWDEKVYNWYTGYPGLHTETAASRRKRKPEKILTEAVRRMLPKNKLAFKMLEKLKVYVGSEHPHQAQQPEPLDIGGK